MMKFLFITIFLITFSTVSLSQEYGDTLFVAIKKGVTLHTKPFETSSRINQVQFNNQLVVLEKDKLDTIELRVANWLEVKTLNGKTGWAFGGYLNKQSLPSASFYSLRYFMPKLHELITIKFETEYLKKGESEMDDIRTHIAGNDNSLTITKSIWENGTTEIQLYNWELHEILNIVALSEWEGQNVEFELLKESASPLSFDRFQWIINFDDPEATMVIEKRYPRGTRIIIDSLY